MKFGKSSFSTLLVNEENYILKISLNRPEKKNAIDPIMTNEFLYAINYAKQNDAVNDVLPIIRNSIYSVGFSNIR